jgi:uncharacterized membrane protein YqjE
VAVTDYDQLGIPELVRRLADTTGQLVHKQIELAKQEAREDLRQTIRGVLFIAAGAVLLLFAVVCLLIGLTAATAQLLGWALWAAALLWLVLFAIVGVVCLLLGKRRIRTQPLSRTRATLEEEREWVRQRLTPPES